MKIMLVNHYAGINEMEHRPSYLAREWTRSGHSVVIVASSFSHLRGRNPVFGQGMLQERVDGIEYLWIKSPAYSGNGPGRVLNMFTFASRLLWMRAELATRAPDVVIASSTHPLDVYPSYCIARRAGGKFVFEVHDLWPLTLIEIGGLQRWHPLVQLFGIAEGFAYRNADRVISILPKAEPYMRSRGMAPHKFVHIPNGVDVVEWRDRPSALPHEHADAIRRLRTDGRFLIGYAGAHGVANALHVLLDAAERLREERATFILIGRGPEKTKLQAAAAARALSNIVFLPPVPRSVIPGLLCEMDALYIGLKDERLFRFGISPNKLIDYMMAAKPVIQAINAGNDLVGEARCGYSIPSENAGKLCEAIRALLATTHGEREAMGSRGRAFAESRHSYAVLAAQFLASLEEQPRVSGAGMVAPA
jgi:glycosyltransferase involved in cell wall biosynthesis